MLQDKFGRIHNYLRISLTDKCNLRCQYCMPEDQTFAPSSHLMQADEILQIAKTFKDLGVTKIRLTGGEPLVRKDFPLILEGLDQIGFELNITTNAVLLHTHFDLFQKVNLNSINISLDTLNSEKFKSITKRDLFAPTIANIYKAKELSLPIKINIVLTKRVNEDEILDFMDWALLNKIEIRFIEFMPFQGNKWQKDLSISKEELLTVLSTKYSINAKESLPNGTASLFSIDHLTFGIISSVTDPFCGGCNRIRLTADGKLKNCLFSSEENDLLNALRSGKDILPIIQKNITSKFYSRGGKVDFQDNNALEEYANNRSMTAIGG